MLDIDNVFVTGIGIDSSFLSLEQCSKIVDVLPQITSRHGSVRGDGFSSYSTTSDVISLIDSFNVVPNIKEKLWDSLVNYSEKTGIVTPKHITNSWFNKQNKGSDLITHTHPFSVLSGALYLYVDEESFPIQFINPNNFVTMQERDRETKYTSLKHDVVPTTGMLILFPSWLSHGSATLNKTSGRIVLSFNTSYS